MTDLSLTVAPKSDQINADDLIGGPRTIRITRVTGNEGNAEQPINIFFEGDGGKPYRPCKSMRRVMIATWGADGNTYAGRSMTLYRDPEVAFGGMKVGGIRISHMSHIDRPMTMALTASKAKRQPYTVKPLADAGPGQADEAMAKARAAARRGTPAFTEWWQSDEGKTLRNLVRPIIDELRDLAQKADEAAKGSESDDPFAGRGDQDDTPRLSPEEEERIRAEIAAQIDAEARAAE